MSLAQILKMAAERQFYTELQSLPRRDSLLRVVVAHVQRELATLPGLFKVARTGTVWVVESEVLRQGPVKFIVQRLPVEEPPPAHWKVRLLCEAPGMQSEASFYHDSVDTSAGAREAGFYIQQWLGEQLIRALGPHLIEVFEA